MTRAQRIFHEGHNYYVPAMKMGADMGYGKTERVLLGAPIVSDADLILDGQSINTAIDLTTFAAGFVDTEAVMGAFGRNLLVVSDGAATSLVTIYGRDYLGQKVVEQFTLNGTNSVVGVKAFRYVDRIVAALTASRTIDVGIGTKFGLPYKTVGVEREFQNGVLAAAGTLTQPVMTDPATATTGDPRGLYVPTTTPDGSKVLELEAIFHDLVNSNGNGGLHGIRHYAG